MTEDGILRFLSAIATAARVLSAASNGCSLEAMTTTRIRFL